jgi:hypothetical protein
MSKIDQIKELNAKAKAAQEEAKKLIGSKACELFAEIAEGIFERHPKLQSFSFVGYTPGFNDGDECTFTWRGSTEKVNGVGECDETDEDDDTPEEFRVKYEDWRDGTEWDNKKQKTVQVKEPGWVSKVCKDVEQSFEFLTEDQVEDMFGTNFELTITKKNGKVKVEKDDYDCGR